MSTPENMVTTGTYNFAPSMGEAVLYAFGLCGVRRTGLTQQHFSDASMATNLLMGRWSADGVNLWQVDQQCVTLVQGCATYQVPSNTIVILDAFYTLQSGTVETDRIMLPVSRSEYASYPNKKAQGTPTVWWFDRLLSPTVTLWPVPNGQQSKFKYFRLRQTQDSTFQNGTNVEIPYYFLEAYCMGLAARLAMIWAPERAVALKQAADEAFMIAAKQNQEQVSMYVSPVMSGYWR